VQFYTEVLGFTVKARDRIERSGLGVPIDLVYLDLGGTVVELISYDGALVDPAPQTEHLGYRMIARSRRYAEDGRLSKDEECRLRLGSKGPRDLLKGGDLRPQRLPHRAKAMVPVSSHEGHGVARSKVRRMYTGLHRYEGQTRGERPRPSLEIDLHLQNYPELIYGSEVGAGY
jgi:hypothetical protein